MAATEQLFVYNFGSSRARYSNFVSIPPKIDIPDTPDPYILRSDAIFDEISNVAAHPWRWSTAEKQSVVTFDRNELETGFDVPLDGYENYQPNKYPFMTFRVDYIGQRSS